jgi:hypothetical protein
MPKIAAIVTQKSKPIVPPQLHSLPNGLDQQAFARNYALFYYRMIVGIQAYDDDFGD